MSHPRIVIQCKEQKNRARWRTICAMIDDDADYEEVVEMLYEYFQEDESRYSEVKKASEGPEFR